MELLEVLIMKVPNEIKTLIQQIQVLESTSRLLWSKLYQWLDENNIDTTNDGDMDSDIIANLQDGVGGQDLIKWLENWEES